MEKPTIKRKKKTLPSTITSSTLASKTRRSDVFVNEEGDWTDTLSPPSPLSKSKKDTKYQSINFFYEKRQLLRLVTNYRVNQV